MSMCGLMYRCVDICQSYMHVLDADISLVKGEIFNVGFENYPVKYLANIVKDVVGKCIAKTQ